MSQLLDSLDEAAARLRRVHATIEKALHDYEAESQDCTRRRSNGEICLGPGVPPIPAAPWLKLISIFESISFSILEKYGHDSFTINAYKTFYGGELKYKCWSPSTEATKSGRFQFEGYLDSIEDWLEDFPTHVAAIQDCISDWKLFIQEASATDTIDDKIQAVLAGKPSLLPLYKVFLRSRGRWLSYSDIREKLNKPDLADESISKYITNINRQLKYFEHPIIERNREKKMRISS